MAIQPTVPTASDPPKPVAPVPITPPPIEERARRAARFAEPGERRTRYSLPAGLASPSPVGYRTRVSLTLDEVSQALPLLSLDPPTGFGPVEPIREHALFEECSLGLLISRQSTNYRGHRQVSFGPEDSVRIGHILRGLKHRDSEVLDDASYTHVVFSKPYRTPFTLLLTFVGHRPVISLISVLKRAWRKRYRYVDDIPTIGYLQQLHMGLLAESMERGAVIASGGRRRAQVHLAPFSGPDARAANRPITRALEVLCGFGRRERRAGWRIAMVVQVGVAKPGEAIPLGEDLCRKLGANLMAFRSERIQPGVNHDDKAPPQYKQRQQMDIPEELTVMAGRAAYNAFSRWAGCEREQAKQLLLLERIDVLTPGGKERLREVRRMLGWVTDQVVKHMPLWADLPTGRAFTRNAKRGRKAFALAGQRIYIGGLSRSEVAAAGLEWEVAVQAVGAAAGRSALVAELMGCVDLPEGCDLLAGICLMAGPVNQNDIGKQFFGQPDLLAEAFPGRDPTSLLVWTLKAKTVADPIGNEEQLLSVEQKGALVDLRAGPHELIGIARTRGDRSGHSIEPMRARDGRVNEARAFDELGNFVTDPDGREIPGNRGEPWPTEWAEDVVWAVPPTR